MNAAELVEKIRKELGRGSRQGHRPSAQIDFGVYTGELRGVVRNFKKELKDESGEFVLQIANALIDENVTDCRQVAYELIAAHKPPRELLNEKVVIQLGQRLDNWCCVDNFCCYIAGAALREGRISDSLIEKWISPMTSGFDVAPWLSTQNRAAEKEILNGP
ncbi:MAG: DNA alkylation repair protein [Verrucomicrobiales bacterium]